MTIKEIIFEKPLANPTLNQILFEMTHREPEELAVGIHDVTPRGYRVKYEVRVEDPGNGDNIGEMIVTIREGKAISVAILDRGTVDFQQSYVNEKKVPLNKNNHTLLLSRVNALDNSEEQGVSVHGIIYYDSKK